MKELIQTKFPEFTIRAAAADDAGLILSLVRELAEYEKLLGEVMATEQDLRETLFGERRFSEVLIGEYQNRPVAFALFFYNYSTFLGKQGLYLEDLYVKPEMRGKGFGKVMLSYVAKLAVKRGCGRFEWSVLDWNTPALDFYRKIGAIPMSDWTAQRVTGEALQSLAKEFSS